MSMTINSHNFKFGDKYRN